MGSLYIGARGCVPVLLENLHGMSFSGPWVVLGFSVGMEAFDELLTCLLRNLYAGQEATVRTGHGTADWFQIGKGVHQGCILSLCSFKFYAEYIMRNAGLEEA